MNLLDLTNVGKTYPARRWWQVWDTRRRAVEALHNVTLSVKRGEVLALLGANGSGKTTLLKIMAGLLSADNGSVMFEGESVDIRSEELRRRVHYLAPDERSFYHRLTVSDNLQLFSTLMENPVSDELLELFQLKALLSRRFGSLSSGQKQRTVLVRALSAGGSLYLLDEPSRSIDEEGAGSIRVWLGGKHRDGVTVIMAFPRKDPLIDFADRVISIEDGRIVS